MINHLAKLKRTTRFAHWRLLPSQVQGQAFIGVHPCSSVVAFYSHL